MYQLDNIILKLNDSNNNKNIKSPRSDGSKITLSDIMVRSFAEVKALAGNALTWGEKNFLYQQAQSALKKNKMAESRILSRANPQLANAVCLGIRQSSMLRGYDDMFPARASSFIKPGSVASMFSPAGYLTELYREARSLHADTSPYHLDKRRPDLASLSLSQSNMDDEISTLSLSNELLLNNIQTQEGKDYEAVLEMLSSYRQSGATPYHHSYEACRNAILLQDARFNAFSRNYVVAEKMDTASLLSIQADISPELREILTEQITDAKADELVRKNFGEVETSIFQNIAFLSNWYGVTYDEIRSLMSLVTMSDNLVPGVQYYQNDQLISLVESDGKLSTLLMTRTPGVNYTRFGYIELIPVSGNNYQLRFTVKDGNVGEGKPVDIGTGGERSADLLENGVISDLNTPVTLSVTLDSAKLLQGVSIGVTRYDSAAKQSRLFASVRFQRIEYSFSTFLLKLNKLIRLYKATGIAPADILAVIESSNSDLTITEDVLSQLFRVKYDMQHYGIDVSAAQVLTGAAISQISHGSQTSAFTRLFNTPALNGQLFAADGTVVELKPDDISDTFRTSVMKRAFGVNDTELYTLWSLASGSAEPGGVASTIENLSALYRVSLLADVHGLSVTELAALLSISPYASRAIQGLSGTELGGLVSFISQYTGWLKAMNWTVSDLCLMTTDRYSTRMSPDIENLINTLNGGLVNQDVEGMDDGGLVSAMAPYIAAAMQLDSAEMAIAIMQWLAQLKPQGLTLVAFLTLVTQEQRTEAETVQLVSFCQVLGQLALFVRKAALTSTELSWVVTHPSVITGKATVLAHDVAMLRELTALHDLLGRCGVNASEIVTSLSGSASTEKNNLAVKTVAMALSLDEQALLQALAQCSSYTYFYNWIQLRDALQWMDVAATFGITPAGVAQLVKLSNASPYSDWVTAGHILQAGLNKQQTAQLGATLDEILSAALSGYAIHNIAPAWATSRDKLYSWLLIDNQVSAKIKTTRIAGAIASVQLYVNRALSGQEEGVDGATKSKTFFASDWDTYNKRYSTWAGVSQLVYYPENYIDPTLRTGQTGMMDEMLQTLSQSQLTSDTVESAFKTYMTRFEEIANLDVISGYHDGVSDQSGTTYLVGKSAIGDYYWRSADIGKMSVGKLPANAWSEWKKITTALTPVNNLVRPVIFQSRLYLTWVESREVATTTGSSTTKSVGYLLKYAHILHDGTWSAPVSVTPDEKTLPLSGVNVNDTGMYCAKDAEQEKLYIYFYKKESSYSTLPSGTAGLSLSSDGRVENISAGTADKMTGYIYLQLDTTTAVRLNTPYTGGNTQVNVTGSVTNGGSWGNLYYTYVTGGQLSVLGAELSGVDVVISFNATTRIIYNGYSGARTATQVEMMKSIGSMGDTFYLPQSRQQSRVAKSSGRNFECVIKDNGNNYDTAFLVTDSIVPSFRENLYGFYDSSTNALETARGVYSEVAFTKSAGNSKLWLKKQTDLGPRNYLYAFMSPWGLLKRPVIDPGNSPVVDPGNSPVVDPGNSPVIDPGNPPVVDPGNPPVVGPEIMTTPVELMFSNFININTSIPAGNVMLSVRGENFTADARTKFTFSESLFTFNNKKISVPLTEFSGNKVEITFTMSVDAPSGDARRTLGREIRTLTLTRVDESSMPVISLIRTDAFAQYLQYGDNRIRVNTLFAKQLVARANAGLNSVLSMETQQLQEPKLGEGFYVDFILPAYDESVHGNSRAFTLVMKRAVDTISKITHVIYDGMLTNSQLSVKLFIPYNGEKNQHNYTIKVFLLTQKDNVEKDNTGAHFIFSNGQASLVENISNISMFFDINIMNDQTTEPMDFSGANALYFWEMFYYVPMMVFKRLLSESKFTEATQWIKRVWSPDGYLVNDQLATWIWNVRPLEEETAWHASPLDSADPDAVAQADPMHYKVATFMAWLDLLIARGDAAYRQLERDTLNEAKMWYMQALDILGDEPYLTQNTGWASPRLSEAASRTTQTRTQQALLAVRQQLSSGELRTANSLTALFLPQQNEKLAGYWQTLAQRLYNLRHNLSIDGSPLSFSVYATPANPAALLSAAVNASSGSGELPVAVMPLYRFPVMLESARSMVGQLTQFGSTLLAINERQDAEALSELLQTQGSALILQSIALQNSAISEIDADKAVLEASLSGARSRLDSYTGLYDEDVNTGEKQAMDLALAASVLSTTATVSYTVAAGLDALPNIYGMAVGGARYGSIPRAIGEGIEIVAGASRTAADRLSQSEIYRRRRQEWEIQRNAAQSEVKQINAQLDALAVRRQGAVLQKTYLETQQTQTQAQMTFLQNKFTSKALYNWLRGKLAAIYYQFYDLTVSRCLMAEKAYQWTTCDETATFIRPGAWQGTYAGLMAGETLMLNLAQMEQRYLEKDQREKEVTRTVCLSEVYAGLSSKAFTLADQVVTLVAAGEGSAGTDDNGVRITGGQLQATLKLSDLNIGDDYPASLGKTRCIKQISVTLPALVGPYQDVRAVLSYGGSVILPRGCNAMAVSHGMNDSGQFQLDFNDSRWLPFEGIPVGDAGTLTLSFLQADSSQKDLLLSLTDIIMHIRYTITS